MVVIYLYSISTGAWTNNLEYQEYFRYSIVSGI